MTPRSHRRTVLVVDDDGLFCDAVRDCLSGDGIETLIANTAEEGVALCSKTKVEVVLLDQKLPDGNGYTLCPQILRCNEQTKIIFVTAYPSFDNAVEAIRAGAHDYLSKPFELEELRLALGQSFRTIDLEKVEEIQNYKHNKEREETVLIGSTGGLAAVEQIVALAASTNMPVLITGETGTGKNVVAKAIHYRSKARSDAFISINCSALPDTLVEAELFGYEKGAFTGAVTAKKGIFEMAEEGTLLLDEVGEMPIHLQTKLLSVLEDKRVKRIGGESMKQVNARIIATTNSDLENAVKMKTFREDLYYPLNVIRIHVPPLRERLQDIPDLCSYLLRQIACDRDIRIPDEEIRQLKEYDWPGNVRELRNVIERAVLLDKGPLIKPSRHLLRTAGLSMAISASEDVISLEEMEQRHISYALEKHSGNYTKTARALGISLSTLKRKLRNRKSAEPFSSIRPK